MSRRILAAAGLAACTAGVDAQTWQSYQLAEGGSSSDVEWSTVGKVSWRLLSSSTSTSLWTSGTPFPAFFPATPETEPYGDVLAYTAGGVGDVDGDGYGDFAVTWYNAEIRNEMCDGVCKNIFVRDYFPWTQNNCPTFINNPEANDLTEDVGFVRVISGNPSGSDMDICQNGEICPNTYPQIPGNMRRIGPDFWGRADGAIWSHEITTIGDIDGDGESDVILAANSAGTQGIVEIWACSDRYNVPNSNAGEQWVKLIEIEGLMSSTVMEEFGYQAYHGPLPLTDANDDDDGLLTKFDVDFNNDDQPDLLVASRWYRNESMGHYVDGSKGRSAAPGAAWIFMMPKADVFAAIHEYIEEYDLSCDSVNNWTGAAGADGIIDDLPLKISSADYNVLIVGHQLSADSSDSLASAEVRSPRWFGYDIDPAGDIDDDGLMDLAVAAPYHVENDGYGTFYTEGEDAEEHCGQVYLFLSDSQMASRPKDGTGDTVTFAEHLPKYRTSMAWLLESRCGVSLPKKVVTTNVQASQICFTSESADFVIAGDVYAATKPGLGERVEAGVSVNGDDDPDLIILDQQDTTDGFKVHVFLDLQGKLSGWTWPTTETETLWTPGGTTSFKPDLTVGTSPSYGGNTLNYFNIRDLDGDGEIETRFAPITDLRIAGNYDGDAAGAGLPGDCELYLSCTAAAPPNYVKGLAIIDVIDGGSIVIADLLGAVLPQNSGITLMSADTGFNEQNVHDDNLVGWPLWHGPNDADARDDAIVGVRGYPVRIQAFPDPSNPLQMISVAPYDSSNQWGQGGTTMSEEAYNQWLTVTAGKVYIVRSVPYP